MVEDVVGGFGGYLGFFGVVFLVVWVMVDYWWWRWVERDFYMVVVCMVVLFYLRNRYMFLFFIS